MRFNRRMSTNIDLNNKLANARQTDSSGASNLARFSASKDVNRYVYPPQASSYSSPSAIRSDCVNSSTLVDDHTVITTIAPKNRNISLQNLNQSFCEYSEEAPLESELLEALPSNILVGTAATDGIGLSTLLSILARYISKQGYSVAIIDADLTHGGLDVLLGLESDEGRRLQEVEAPLGRCDGYVLKNELIHWDDVDVLAFSPWRSERPEPWVVEAVIRALAEACDVVIVDIGSGKSSVEIYKSIPQLSASATLASVELSVLDLARFRAYSHVLKSTCNVDITSDEFAAIGMCPRGLKQKSYVLNVDEASEYLSTQILGFLPYDSNLHADIIGGYGIREVPSCMKSAMKELGNWLLAEAIFSKKESSNKHRHSKFSHFSYSRGKYGRK